MSSHIAQLTKRDRTFGIHLDNEPLEAATPWSPLRTLFGLALVSLPADTIMVLVSQIT